MKRVFRLKITCITTKNVSFGSKLAEDVRDTAMVKESVCGKRYFIKIVVKKVQIIDTKTNGSWLKQMLLHFSA